MNKPCNLVMLSSSKKAIIGNIVELENSELMLIDDDLTHQGLQIDLSNGRDINTKHLYIISSDEEIKDGDWFITFDIMGRPADICHATKLKSDGKMYDKITDNNYILTRTHTKKIIATTDTSLGIVKYTEGGNVINGGHPCLLPQPSQQFIQQYIEEYNKGNIITEVEVEYDLFWNNQKHKHQPFPDEFASEKDRVYDLKINSDNTINIKPIKTSWTKEEHIAGLYKAYKYGIQQGINPTTKSFDKWIEENL